MTSFWQNLFSRSGEEPPPPEVDPSGFADELRAAHERIAQLEAELEASRAELEKAENDREQISRLTDDMAASHARTASSASELNRAKTELQGLNETLEKNESKLNRALAEAMESNQAKDQMFAAVARAIEEITECLSIASKSCSENAKASQAAGSAADSAMTEATGMAQCAAEIIDVSGAIRAVADRTRLLSLNAKIEASKAQEFGRGFSVVADEVRKLSQEASEASERIANVAGAIEKGTQGIRRLILEVRETTNEVNVSSGQIVTTAKRQEDAINGLLSQIGEKHGGDVDLF